MSDPFQDFDEDANAEEVFVDSGSNQPQPTDAFDAPSQEPVPSFQDTTQDDPFASASASIPQDSELAPEPMMESKLPTGDTPLRWARWRDNSIMFCFAFALLDFDWCWCWFEMRGSCVDWTIVIIDDDHDRCLNWLLSIDLRCGVVTRAFTRARWSFTHEPESCVPYTHNFWFCLFVYLFVFCLCLFVFLHGTTFHCIPLSKWQESRKQVLAQRKAASDEAKLRLIEDAKNDITKFYSQRAENVQKTQATNRFGFAFGSCVLCGLLFVLFTLLSHVAQTPFHTLLLCVN